VSLDDSINALAALGNVDVKTAAANQNPQAALSVSQPAMATISTLNNS
jgi:hypothetical protein